VNRVKKDINPVNAKGEPHGYCEIYWGDMLWYKCVCNNGEEIGYEELYFNHACDKLIKIFHL